MQWGSYEPFVPLFASAPRELTRAQAKAEFDLLMEVRHARIAMLRDLAALGGVSLDGRDSSIQALDDWFRAHVEGEPGIPGQLATRWYSVVSDIGLFLGEVVLERRPDLRWMLHTWGKRNFYYHRAVIGGYPPDGLDTHVVSCLDLGVATYGQRITLGLEVSGTLFVGAVRYAVEKPKVTSGEAHVQ